MIKVGDWVEVVKGGAYHDVGDIFMIAEMRDLCYIDVNSKAIMKGKVRPLNTAAENRGPKLGTGITFKPSGTKGFFWKSNQSILGEEWSVLMADGNILTTSPEQIRLDHEPEYREIPFSEATHEQRMDVSALRFDGTPVEQIFRFDNGEYMFTISACKAVANAWNILKVRIPT